DHLVYGNDDRPETAPGKADGPKAGPSGEPLDMDSFTTAALNVKSTVVVETQEEMLPERGTFSARLGETPARNGSTDHSESGRPSISIESLSDLWDQEQRMARRRLEPESALIGATRELQAGLGAFLQTCHEHGGRVGPWRLQHVVGEWTFGEHPTYGVLTIAHWMCKDAQ